MLFPRVQKTNFIISRWECKNTCALLKKTDNFLNKIFTQFSFETCKALADIVKKVTAWSDDIPLILPHSANRGAT